jgi:hypothetical protein
MRPRWTRVSVLLLAGAMLTGAACSTAPEPGSSAAVAAVDGAGAGATVASGAAAAPEATKKPRPSKDPSASPKPGGGGGPAGSAPSSPAPIPTDTGFPGTIVLGKPTATAMTVSLLAASALDVYIEHGAASGGYTAKTATKSIKAGVPTEITLTGLVPDTAWAYRIRYRTVGKTSFAAAVRQSFRTQRSAASAFTFAVQADPHIDVDRKTQPALVRRTLENIASDDPDFLVDLGDTFLGDKFATSWADVVKRYVNVRSYFGITGPSVPLFLVNGNHEGEDGWALDGTSANLSVWAAKARKLYYPEPSAGSFYSASAVKEPFVGERDSYYAWEWGDALFVVLDPYSYTTTDPRKSGDLWDWTLGEAQHAWLERVLSESSATYTFVFAHHVVGDVRGGVEWTDLYEWGGHGKDGTDAFDTERPGWGLPIHDLFVKYGVTIFFQGHDHLFVRQEQDGVVYQEVPQPGTPGGDAQNQAHEYAYTSGVILPSTGHLEVTVAPTGVTVDYVRSSVTASGGAGTDNGEVVYSYTVPRPTDR